MEPGAQCVGLYHPSALNFTLKLQKIVWKIWTKEISQIFINVPAVRQTDSSTAFVTSWLDHVTSVLVGDVTSVRNRQWTDKKTWRNGLTFQTSRATFGNQTHRSIYRRTIRVKLGHGTGSARDDTSNQLDSVTRIMKTHRCRHRACALSITWPVAAPPQQQHKS